MAADVKARGTASPVQRAPLPAGAAKWSKTYLGADGKPQASFTEVPVDANDRRTAHVRHTCKGQIEIGGVRQQCDHVMWLDGSEGPRFCPDHGCQLEPVEKIRVDGLLRKVWQAIHLEVRPVYGLAAGLMAGVVLHRAGAPVWAPLVAAPVAAGVGYGVVWQFLTGRAKRSNPPKEITGRRLRKYQRRARLGAYTGLAGSGFLSVAAAVDPSTRAGQLVWGVALLPSVLCCVPWWRYRAAFRNRPEPVEETPEPVKVEPTPSKYTPEALQDAAGWSETVAVTGGLPGTSIDLDTWAPDPGGRRMVIRSKGPITDEKMRQALPLIAAAFDVPRSSIGWVEEYEGSPRSALLLVQPKSPLNDGVAGKPVDILDIDNARAHMGMKIDGTDLHTTLWTPGWGAPSRIVLGCKGSGKSALLRRLLLVMLLARIQSPTGPRRLIAPFLHDPKLGADYGAFRRQVCGFSITSETLHMIVEAFIREMDRRYIMIADTVWTDDKGREREGERPFDPTTMGPVLSLVLDEFHINAKDQALMGKLDPFARKMRAAGIEITFATHLATIGDTGSQGFRDMTAGGEAWLLRTTLGLNASLATGGQLVGDPRALPRVPGSLLHASGEEATMQARAAWDDPEDLYDLLYDDNNVSRVQPIDWPAETLEAFGRDFCQWMEDCQRRPIGSAAPGVPAGYKPAGGPTVAPGDAKAGDALLSILFVATRPLSRDEIVAHPLWSWSVRTLSNELKRHQAEGRARKVDGTQTFELTPAYREHAEQQVAEQFEEQLEELAG